MAVPFTKSWVVETVPAPIPGRRGRAEAGGRLRPRRDDGGRGSPVPASRPDQRFEAEPSEGEGPGTGRGPSRSGPRP